MVLVCGYYGFGNWGDEASLQAVLSAFGPDRCVVATADPLRSRHPHSVARYPSLEFGQALEKATSLVLGGGSLLQDATSLRSLVYYVSLIRAGQRKTKRVGLVLQGLGPFRRRISRAMVRWALRDVGHLSVRDEASLALLKAIGARQEAILGSDATFALEMPSEQKTNIAILSPRPWPATDPAPAFTNLAVKMKADGLEPCLIAMQANEDLPLCRQIAQESGCTVLGPFETLQELLGAFAQASAVVAMRLHAGIFSTKAGTAPLLIAYDPKVSALCSMLGLESTVNTEDLGPSGLVDAWRAHWAQQTRLDERLIERAASAEQRAQAALEKAKSFVGI